MRSRYLLDLKLAGVPALTCDVCVLGAGTAGLSAALAAAERGASVIVLAKGRADESNSSEAQGGVAVALAPGDSPEAHARDTIEAGAGLCEAGAVDVLVREGPARVQELLDWGAAFDTDAGGALAFTEEGAHGRPRIVHAAGDATGREISRVLGARAAAEPRITILERHFAVDLLHADGRAWGALAVGPDAPAGRGAFVRVRAGATVLATGGLGRVYRETTNPAVATGDGVAMAFRAGAVASDMEFVQFHPTTLYLAGAPRFLVSEAVRGEGAHLLDAKGRRFMTEIDPRAELAPRDVVSQAIQRELHRTGAACVYLDLSPLDAARVRARFPTIANILAQFGLDLARDRIPVRPAAHYAMGGVRTDLAGATSVRALWACGECASTGVHGANRLASNSLLEALVFGRRAGEAAAAHARAEGRGRFPLDRIERGVEARSVPLDLADVRRSLTALMWRAAGVFREGESLAAAEEHLAFWQGYVYRGATESSKAFELQNMLAVAQLVVRGARLRAESRGAHQRLDHPDAAGEARHTVLTRANFENDGRT